MIRDKLTSLTRSPFLTYEVSDAHVIHALVVEMKHRVEREAESEVGLTL